MQLGDLLQRGQCLQKAGVLLVKVKAGACGELAREQILRPRRTGAAGRTAALATRWPFQRRDAAGR